MASRTAVNVARRAASTLTGASRSRLVAPSAASLNNFAAAPSAQQPLRRSATTSAGAALASLAAASPHVDVVRYEHKNVKWTLSHVDKNSEALAVGFIENGLRPGDVVLSWLPQHFGEEHILQFACSKAGLVLYNLDPAQAITDPEGAKKSLAKALEVTEANVLVTQEAGNDTNYIKLVESVVPETRMFNFGDGMPFFSPRFPHLRFPIHTGFDITDKAGMEPLKHMLCPADTLQDQLAAIGAKIDGKTPLMGELTMGSDGLPQKGKVLSNEDVYKSGAWPTFSSILKKDYVEIEGIGVVW